MDNQDKTNDQLAEHDQAIYVPDEIYHSIQNIFGMMKDARRELHKVRNEMKPVENVRSKKY